MLKLRKQAYGLIDLQRQETTFHCLWYRMTKSLFNGFGADITMLLWELHDQGPETTVLSWRI